MKIILTVLACALMNFTSAQLVSEDDLLHGAIGVGISATTYAIVHAKTKNPKKAFWYSLGVSTLAGLSKEIYDGFMIEGKFDTGEVIATFGGGLIASYTFHIFTGTKRKKRRKQKEKYIVANGLSF